MPTKKSITVTVDERDISFSFKDGFVIIEEFDAETPTNSLYLGIAEEDFEEVVKFINLQRINNG